ALGFVGAGPGHAILLCALYLPCARSERMPEFAGFRPLIRSAIGAARASFSPVLRATFKKGSTSNGEDQGRKPRRRNGRRRDDPHYLAADQGQADASLPRYQPSL